MNTQLITRTFETMDITMIQDDEHEIWFKGHDVASILGYKKPRNAIIQHVEEEDKVTLGDMKGALFQGGYNIQPHTVFINESGLYSLILRSKLAAAKQFKRWVTKDVLPSIRKTGNYTMPQKDTRSYIEDAAMIENISNAKIQMLLNDRLMNELQATNNQGPKDEWCRDIMTLVKDVFNKRINSTEASTLGKYIAKKYRKNFNKDPEKYDKFVNGNSRKVNAYTKADEVHIIKWLHEYYN